MTVEQKKQLIKLQQVQKNKMIQLQKKNAQAEIIDNIEEFETRYRFANDNECRNINNFLNTIPSLSPTRPNFNVLPMHKPT